MSNKLFHPNQRMMKRTIIAAVAALLAATCVGQFALTLLDDSDALCLDGSHAGYYFKQGDPDTFIISMQGGAWCFDALSCLQRSNTSLGSSRTWAAEGKFGGLLDASEVDNPVFFNATAALLPYCDGAGFAGGLTHPLIVNGTALYFRGHSILTAALDALLQSRGLARAKTVIVMGGSAGGLSTLLHADYILEYIQAHGGRPTKTAAFPDCSFFLATAPDVFGRPYALGEFMAVVDMQNVTGSPQQVDAGCWAATPPSLRWQCFVAAFVYPHVTTPLFLTNSQYDTYQLSNIWAPPGDGVDASYGPCIADPLHKCNATQYEGLQSYHVLFQATLNQSLSANPNAYTLNGGMITSCMEHGQQEEGLWDVIEVGGVTMRDAIAEWFFQARGPGAGYWRMDGPFPGNPTCPPPAALAGQ